MNVAIGMMIFIFIVANVGGFYFYQKGRTWDTAPPHFVKKHEITAHHEWAVPPLAVSRNLTGSGGGRAGGEEGKVLQIKKGKLGV